MPIIVKDVEWDQSESKLGITLPQNRVASSSVDVMVTPSYIKVNYSPYFCDVHLLHEVDDTKSRVVIGDGSIAIYLEKRSPGIWECLNNPDAKDPSKKRELVASAYRYHEDKIKADVEARAKVKAEQNRIALRTQMDQDSGEKERIESVKQAERDRVTGEMHEWQSLDDHTKKSLYLNSVKENQQPEVVNENVAVQKKTESHPVDKPDIPETQEPTKLSASEERARKFEKIKHNLANPLKPDGDARVSGGEKKKKEGSGEKSVWSEGGVRQSKEIRVSFSPRYFPSAARESLVDQENAWIEKNVRAQAIVKPADADTKEGERNPMWLCDKANVFYKMGNFPAAINAYSEAISISPSLPKLYINRASCYLVLNLFQDAVIDCTRALDLLTPPVEANRLSRVRTLAKRGSAFCQLGEPDKALVDYKLASRLSPENESLKKDIEVLESQQTPPTQAQLQEITAS